MRGIESNAGGASRTAQAVASYYQLAAPPTYAEIFRLTLTIINHDFSCIVCQSNFYGG
jgi:hypothetical protein